jgi:hypothetical protein
VQDGLHTVLGGLGLDDGLDLGFAAVSTPRTNDFATFCQVETAAVASFACWCFQMAINPLTSVTTASQVSALVRMLTYGLEGRAEASAAKTDAENRTAMTSRDRYRTIFMADLWVESFFVKRG